MNFELSEMKSLFPKSRLIFLKATYSVFIMLSILLAAGTATAAIDIPTQTFDGDVYAATPVRVAQMHTLLLFDVLDEPSVSHVS